MTNKELAEAIEATEMSAITHLSHLKALHLEQLKRACLTPQPTLESAVDEISDAYLCKISDCNK
tara:strand:- start:1517 stop:1708 length:192 start_codon:yes stop_codon:yes gene_type:complete